jgi:hypothetical protein
VCAGRARDGTDPALRCGVTSPQTHVTAAPADTQPCARFLWAEEGWRCFLTPRHVRLYSGGKRLLTHPVQTAAEGEGIADLWLRSIRRIGDLASADALIQG